MRKLLCLAILCCVSCAAPASTTRTAPIDGAQRLAQDVTPTAYRVALTIDPARDHFSGEVQVQISVAAAGQRQLVMHAEGLAVEAATITDAQGRAMSAAAAYGEGGALVLSPASPLGAGAHTVALSFSGALGEAPMGLYRVKDDGRWYAFTQFEPLEARKAFPCFDEPRFKTPFTLSITTPAGLNAFANAPQASVSEQAGQRTTTFAPTKPLPTYLVALAVGELDVLEAPADAIPGVPLRIIATKGKAQRGAWILSHTPQVLKALTDYFGMPYPYEKLDLVAVPNFGAGAMENVGLVTFREGLLLMDEALATPDMKMRSISVLTHELAHMWFGNLVTPVWWDELWLNESFASWMEDVIIAKLTIEGLPEVDRVSGLGWVMDADSREQTRAIRQPIRHSGDIYDAFDGMTYSKGARILHMVEQWLGPEVFRDAIRAYMKANQHGQVTSAALFAALSQASDKPVTRVISTFVDRPGAPLVSAELRCAADGSSLHLEQRRYLPAGSKASQQAEPWAIPMCVRLIAADAKPARECFVFDAPTLDLPLKSCPIAVHPNDAEAGYYHWSLPDAQLGALLERGALSTDERLGLLIHLDALVASGQRRPLDAWQATITLASAPDAPIPLKERLVETLAGLEEAARRSGQLDAWRALLLKTLTPLLDEVGVEPKPGEPATAAGYRVALLYTLGHHARSPYVLATAQAVLANFLETPDQIPAGRLRWALGLAAEGGDAMLWERLVEIAVEAKSPAVRSSALSALGYFSEPALQDRSLALLLDPRVRSNELWALYGPMMRDPALYARAWAWLKANHASLAAKLGEEGAASLPRAGGGFCDAAAQADVRAFFTSLPGPKDDMERGLSQTLERIGACDVQVNATLDDLKVLLGEQSE